jgi:hypothetical protein
VYVHVVNLAAVQVHGSGLDPGQRTAAHERLRCLALPQQHGQEKHPALLDNS